MSRSLYVIIIVAIVAIVFLAMWLGWRARSRRDANVLPAQQPPAGELLERFQRVFYVSTTPEGAPLSRVAAPGLRYRGRADIEVREGGVTVAVDGEQPVHFAAAQLRGAGSASRRVGKAVESGGLGLLLWSAAEQRLESSFRFDSDADQRRFTAAIDKISPSSSSDESTHQEGAK